MEQQLILSLFSLLPALIVGFVAFYFFKMHTTNENQKRKQELHKEAQQTSLPLRFQAYERMALFLERITLSKLLLRIAPIGNEKEAYANLLIANIEQEFDHNLAQQIYISDSCWNVIKTAKNTTIQMIRSASELEQVTDANNLREHLIKSMVDKTAPSDTGLAFIKNEVGELFR